MVDEEYIETIHIPVPVADHDIVSSYVASLDILGRLWVEHGEHNNKAAGIKHAGRIEMLTKLIDIQLVMALTCKLEEYTAFEAETRQQRLKTDNIVPLKKGEEKK